MSDLFFIVFYQPIFNILVFLYNLVPDIGFAIIVLTLLIRLVLYPLNHKALQSQRALQDLQPKLDQLKKEHKGDQQELGRAMMALYKKEKINPFSSCLPLLIQLPFLIGVFYVFRNGLSDPMALDAVYSFISRPETINPVTLGYFNLSAVSPILAVLAGAAQFWQAKMMVTRRQPSVDGAQDENMTAIMNKQMVYFLPIITVVIGMTFPAGLTLYWLITTLATGAQQWFIFRDGKKPAVEVIDKK